MAEETRVATGSAGNNPGPFLAKVISHLDPNYMGSLEVQLLHEVGNTPLKEGQLHVVKYMSPFAGNTSIEYVGEEETYNNAQKSYGWWAVPPDVGATVIVFFIEGDPRKGFWIGCVQDENMNFMTPGLAATSFVIDGDEERVPVAEYNKKAIPVGNNDSTKNRKAQHPFTKILQTQGLLLDDARGITTSSARREAPSSVFGISTPGPVDKQPGATKGKVGKAEHQIAGAFVSRLGGTTFVMDDGDDKFLRKTPASEGPPQYASVEQNETGGDVTIPHNELVRIRTRTGHQILLHNSEDLIYIGNARGTAWVELTSNGKIDIYSQDSISIHTENDLNIRADRDINMEAGRNINFRTETGRWHADIKTDLEFFVENDALIKIEKDFNLRVGSNSKIFVDSDYNLKTGGNNKFTAGSNTEILSGGFHLETAKKIHMNGPEASIAEEAEELSALELKENPGTEKSIMARIPIHEPWELHENLDPEKVSKANTDRGDNGGRGEADESGSGAGSVGNSAGGERRRFLLPPQSNTATGQVPSPGIEAGLTKLQIRTNIETRLNRAGIVLNEARYGVSIDSLTNRAFDFQQSVLSYGVVDVRARSQYSPLGPGEAIVTWSLYDLEHDIFAIPGASTPTASIPSGPDNGVTASVTRSKYSTATDTFAKVKGAEG